MARQRASSPIASALLVVTVAACSPAPSPAPSPSPVVDSALADRLAASLEAGLDDLGAPGVQAAVAFPDGSVWTDTAGVSTAGRPMTPDLLMAIGSVTKVYTAALVLDLADDGIVGLDDPLTRWLPEAANADGVTLRQLLLHTSGVASDDPALPAVCEPGTCLSYSNSGYAELGMVIERATGSDYAAVLRERVLDPLGLESTFDPAEEALRGDPAIGHLDGDEASAVDAATVAGSAWGRGASGGLVATAADTARFAHAVFAGSVLTPAGLEALLDVDATVGLPGADDCVAEAMLSRRGGSYGASWNHGGNTGFFRAWIEHYPRYGVTIAVDVNSSALPVGLIDRLADVAMADAPVVDASADPGGACQTDLAILTADGAVRAVTTTPDVDGQPSWSPDGRSLAWITYHGGQNDVLTGDIVGSEVVQLTDDPAQDVAARWSPDGSAIAFSSDRDGDHEIYLMAPDGSDVRQLTRNDTDDWLPAWSPDGTAIAYVSAAGEQHLRVMAVDGSDDRVVEGAGGAPWWPTWSPDGTRLAYESGGVIFIVPVDGGEPTRLPIPQIRVTRFPAWAPGTDIAFSSDGDLYATSEDGTTLRRLTATPTTESVPAWAPDGASIAFEYSFWVPATDR